jgi:hypothetical protein
MMKGLRNNHPSKNEADKLKELKYMISMLHQKFELAGAESTTKEQANKLLDDAIENAQELIILFRIASKYATAELRGGSRKHKHHKRRTQHKRRTHRSHRK